LNFDSAKVKRAKVKVTGNENAKKKRFAYKGAKIGSIDLHQTNTK